MSRRRTLTQGERALWTYVTRHVAPIKPSVTVTDEDIALLAAEVTPPLPPPRLTAKAAENLFQAPAPKAPKPAATPPLMPLERRLRQRLARGSHPIEAVLDLHGMRQVEAHERLRRFLMAAQAGGSAVVLVVTGKGGAGTDAAPGHPGERGVLRRVVPHWLRLPDLRGIVLGFEEAAQHHGGGGALYVRLRKRREP